MHFMDEERPSRFIETDKEGHVVTMRLDPHSWEDWHTYTFPDVALFEKTTGYKVAPPSQQPAAHAGQVAAGLEEGRPHPLRRATRA